MFFLNVPFRKHPDVFHGWILYFCLWNPFLKVFVVLLSKGILASDGMPRAQTLQAIQKPAPSLSSAWTLGKWSGHCFSRWNEIGTSYSLYGILGNTWENHVYPALRILPEKEGKRKPDDLCHTVHASRVFAVSFRLSLSNVEYWWSLVLPSY